MAAGVGVDESVKLEDTKSITKMGDIVCDLCRSPYVTEIEGRFLAGEDVSGIARLYGCNHQLIRSHMRHRKFTQELKATSDSISNDVKRWRDRTEDIYERVLSMLDEVERGLVLDHTPEGQPILSKPRLAEIKPVTDSLIKLVGSAAKVIELFAKTNQIFAGDSGSGGPTIIINLGLPPEETPTVIDLPSTAKVEQDDRDSRMLEIAGEELYTTLARKATSSAHSMSPEMQANMDYIDQTVKGLIDSQVKGGKSDKGNK
jgi:hypothetical protein